MLWDRDTVQWVEGGSVQAQFHHPCQDALPLGRAETPSEDLRFLGALEHRSPSAQDEGVMMPASWAAVRTQ